MSVPSKYWILEWDTTFDISQMQRILGALFGGDATPTKTEWLCVQDVEKAINGTKIWRVWVKLDVPKTGSELGVFVSSECSLKPAKVAISCGRATLKGAIPADIVAKCVKGRPYVQYGISTDWAAIGEALREENVLVSDTPVGLSWREREAEKKKYIPPSSRTPRSEDWEA